MKNLFTYLITMQRWLRKNTMEAAAKQLSIPTVTRRSTDGQSPERRPVEAGRAASAEKGQPITLHYLYRYAAMIFCVLVMSIGQAWGTDFTPAQIVANSGAGTTTDNIKVSSSYTSTEDNKLCVAFSLAMKPSAAIMS